MEFLSGVEAVCVDPLWGTIRNWAASQFINHQPFEYGPRDQIWGHVDIFYKVMIWILRSAEDNGSMCNDDLDPRAAIGPHNK